MRIFSILLIIVALCVSSSWATFAAEPNGFLISGPNCASGSRLNYTSSGNVGTCNSVCGGRIAVKSDQNGGPKTTFSFLDYGKNVTNCDGRANTATFNCPAMLTNGTSPSFTVSAGDKDYHLTCVYVVNTPEPAAGNSADKVAVGIAIIFGALISLLAL
ncbi:hypothetical protein RB653_000095 [Dictyostelium firmibasis]|uniref:Uncharacterized protein n=1 Tax=Dictyostelium firmibasis TaxID=79012 RepID=A0AAN7TW42_9MYCE